MARAKMKCNGKTQNGTPCKNWALSGSMYCQLHQGQETTEDRKTMENTESTANFIIVAIVVLGFIISLAMGCEQEFINWLGN
ncbi:MAG: hypothetical protein ABJH08_04300 [Balneola sp.]